MRTPIVVGVLVGTLLAVSCLALGGAITLTVGISQAYLLWQTSPEIYADSTLWGGIGLGLVYKSINFRASVSLVDLETFRITDHPSFAFGAGITIFKIGTISLSVGTSLMIQPYNDIVTVSASMGFGWSPFPFVDFSTGIGVQQTLPVSSYQGTNINWGLGVHFSWSPF